MVLDHCSSGKIMNGSRVEDEIRRNRLFKEHLAYLNVEDSPEKLAHKTKLEGLILDYLSSVPHSKKFHCIEVAECLNRSILVKEDDFNANRAAIAFEALEKYANNLLTKPWRKEFRLIYPFGEFVRDLINKELVGASRILYLIGYRSREVNGFTAYVAEPSAIDPDTLAWISLDCLIAFVECQMMLQISEALKKKEIHISWPQILDIRSYSIGGMDQVVNYVIDSNIDSKIQKLVDMTSHCHMKSTN